MRRNRDYADSTRNNDNPSVMEMSNRADGRALAYEAVLDALKGSRILLKIDACGHIGCDNSVTA